MTRHVGYIDRAVMAAKLSDCRFTLGAVIVRSGRVLSVASNKWRNSPAIDHRFASWHAEVAALKQCAQPKGRNSLRRTAG